MLTINANQQANVQSVVEMTGWCTAPDNQKLLVGDWNGDGLTDLLCHHQTGEMKVLLNQAGQLYKPLKSHCAQNECFTTIALNRPVLVKLAFRIFA